jgi:uncharacterized integral membrane protein
MVILTAIIEFIASIFEFILIMFLLILPGGLIIYGIGIWSEKSMKRKNKKQRQADALGGKIIWFISHFFR